MPIFDDKIDVHHGFIQVLFVPAPGLPDPTDEQVLDGDHSTTITGQTNGLGHLGRSQAGP
jgi:hypothetical protein